MLELRYLFDNRDLALMLLENWEYDKDELDMLNNFRISGNAIYPFKCNGDVYFLRFTPWTNVAENEMNEEIKFIQYLKGKGLGVLKPKPAKNDNYLLIKDTPWGKYLVCAFERVEGDRLDGLNGEGVCYNDDLITGYGKTLGKLHKYSSEYGKVSKQSCFETLEEMDIYVKNKLNDKEMVKNEINSIRNLLQKIPRNKSNFGLIHGDYEFDNVFYDKKTKKYSVIDFGSSIYHWYAMDIEITLDNLKEELPKNDFEKMEKLFIDGYNLEYRINEEEIRHFPLFRRLENLRKYIGLKISLEETWDNEPSWMLELRAKLNKYTMRFENAV